MRNDICAIHGWLIDSIKFSYFILFCSGMKFCSAGKAIFARESSLCSSRMRTIIFSEKFGLKNQVFKDGFPLGDIFRAKRIFLLSHKL